MSFFEICSLQLTLFLLMLTGAVLAKRKILAPPVVHGLTDLCVDLVIPCNIIRSFLSSGTSETLKTCIVILAVGFLVQGLCIILNGFLFNQFPEQQKKVLQYCTIVSNGGFLGNPVAEGIYGNTGLLYASVFLIPMRIIMWSVGTSYFLPVKSSQKTVIRNILTHPCLIGVYIGLFLMLSGFSLPSPIALVITNIGACNTALTMFIVGTILADIKISSVFHPVYFLFGTFRLLIFPTVALILCQIFSPDPVGKGIAVIMTGMPAGATAAIFAARYNGDAPFATRCVVLTTLLSMITLPLWCWILNSCI